MSSCLEPSLTTLLSSPLLPTGSTDEVGTKAPPAPASGSPSDPASPSPPLLTLRMLLNAGRQWPAAPRRGQQQPRQQRALPRPMPRLQQRSFRSLAVINMRLESGTAVSLILPAAPTLSQGAIPTALPADAKLRDPGHACTQQCGCRTYSVGVRNLIWGRRRIGDGAALSRAPVVASWRTATPPLSDV